MGNFKGEQQLSAAAKAGLSTGLAESDVELLVKTDTCSKLVTI